jgi:hypothetical protein
MDSDGHTETVTIHEERLILIEHCESQRLRHKHAAHEVAHAILFSTHPPKSIHYWPRMGEDSHMVACLVEEWVDLEFTKGSQLSLFRME